MSRQCGPGGPCHGNWFEMDNEMDINLADTDEASLLADVEIEEDWVTEELKGGGRRSPLPRTRRTA